MTGVSCVFVDVVRLTGYFREFDGDKEVSGGSAGDGHAFERGGAIALGILVNLVVIRGCLEGQASA